MKKLYFMLVALFVTASLSAQFTFTPISQGVWQMVYSQQPKWESYNPGTDSTIYVHLFTNGGENSTGNNFQDDWNNSTVVLKWDATYANPQGPAGAYVGIINLNEDGHVFTETNKPLPAETTVTKLNFKLKNVPTNNPTKESIAFAADMFGFKATTTIATTLAVKDVNGLSKRSLVSQGKLYTEQRGNLDIQVFDFGGKVVKALKVNANGNPIDINLAQKGLYLMKVTNGQQTEVVKFAY